MNKVYNNYTAINAETNCRVYYNFDVKFVSFLLEASWRCTDPETIRMLHWSNHSDPIGQADWKGLLLTWQGEC